MVNIMENLINNKFYKTKEEIEKKLNMFFAFNVISEENYTKLMELVNVRYSASADKRKIY